MRDENENDGNEYVAALQVAAARRFIAQEGTVASLLHGNRARGTCGSAFSALLRTPRWLLICSRAFRRMHAELDPDFKADLVTDSEMRVLDRKVRADSELFECARTLLGDDCCI